MKLDFSINTENQKDVEEALGILNSLSNDKFSSTSPVVCPDREYICKTNVGIANIIEEDEGIYRILTGSIVAKDTSPSCSAKTKKLREQLISNGTIEIVGDKGIVRKDIGDLLSKSLTASIVTGTNTNGNVRLIEKSPQKISEPTKMARNTYIEHDVLSSESIEDLTLLYNRVYDLLDFIFRDDIPAEMSSLSDLYEILLITGRNRTCQTSNILGFRFIRNLQ